MEKQNTQEFELNVIRCEKGDCSAMGWMGRYFIAQLSEETLRREQETFAAQRQIPAFAELTDYLLKRPEEMFAANAAAFWFYRGAHYGDKASQEALEAHPLLKTLSIYIWDCWKINASLWSGDLFRYPYELRWCWMKAPTRDFKGFGLRFLPKGNYNLQLLQKYRIFEVKTDAGSSGPDSDGFGMEEYYDFYYYDEFFNPLGSLLGQTASYLSFEWETRLLPECLKKQAEYQRSRMC